MARGGFGTDKILDMASAGLPPERIKALVAADRLLPAALNRFRGVVSERTAEDLMAALNSWAFVNNSPLRFSISSEVAATVPPKPDRQTTHPATQAPPSKRG